MQSCYRGGYRNLLDKPLKHRGPQDVSHWANSLFQKQIQPFIARLPQVTNMSADLDEDAAFYPVDKYLTNMVDVFESLDRDGPIGEVLVTLSRLVDIQIRTFVREKEGHSTVTFYPPDSILYVGVAPAYPIHAFIVENHEGKVVLQTEMSYS